MQSDHRDIAYTCLDKQELISFQESIITDTNHSFTSKNYKPDIPLNTEQDIELNNCSSLIDPSKSKVLVTQQPALLTENNSNHSTDDEDDELVDLSTSKTKKPLLQIRSIDKVTAMIITAICLIIIGVAVFHFTKPPKTNKSTTTAKELRVDQVDNYKPKLIKKAEPELPTSTIKTETDKNNLPNEAKKANPAGVVVNKIKSDTDPDESDIANQRPQENLDEVIDYEDFIKESTGTIYRES